MRLALLLGAALAVPIFASPAAAQTNFSLPGVTSSQPQVQYVQATDPRIAQMEEQVRQLNGLVEELNFQVLQMQDQLRRMQEDNEFRFQELEGSGDGVGSGDAAGGDRTNNTAVPPSGGQAAASSAPPSGTSSQAGAPPRELGSITFDGQGNITGGQMTEPVAPQPGTGGLPGADGTTVAALPQTDDADQLYRNSYEFILSGDYATAESGFRDMIERFPDNGQIPDAHFWLGEALLGQERYRDAAETFLAASKDFPQSRRAPEMLFKLGVSLAALNQREVACATFDEVGQRYPQMSDALKERVAQEKSLTSC